MHDTITVERHYEPDPARQAAAILKVLESSPRKLKKEEGAGLQPAPVNAPGMPPKNIRADSSDPGTTRPDHDGTAERESTAAEAGHDAR